MKRIIFYCFIAFSVLSCTTPRNLVFFSDIQDTSTVTEKIVSIGSPKIQPGDILSISVNTLNPESNVLFNSGSFQQLSDSRSQMGALNSLSVPNNGSRTGVEGYQVNSNGFINFPVIGEIKFVGLTREQAQKTLQEKLEFYVSDPIVNISFLNFKVTVIGEVNRPSSFTINNDRINVLEAIGMAGDMTMYGKRENVLLIRENEGLRTLIRLNLNNSGTFNSPYFQLQQNDILYVEPDRMKERQASTNVRTISLIASFTTVLVVAISRFL